MPIDKKTMKYAGKVKTETTVLEQAIRVVETISGTNTIYTVKWRFERQEQEPPPLALQNQIIITDAIFSSLDKESQYILMEYVSFGNFWAGLTGQSPPFHLFDYAKGVLAMKWISDGMMFLWKYALQPIQQVRSGGYIFSLPTTVYEGTFWVQAEDMPVILAVIGSFLYSTRSYIAEEGTASSLVSLFPRMKYERGTLEALLPVIEHYPTGSSVVVDVEIPPEISWKGLFLSLHLSEVIKGRSWREKE